jgi:dolichyl-phosphate-mannose--protein O-mannosyl transferase
MSSLPPEKDCRLHAAVALSIRLYLNSQKGSHVKKDVCCFVAACVINFNVFHPVVFPVKKNRDKI